MYKYFKFVKNTNKKVKILLSYKYFYIRQLDKFLFYNVYYIFYQKKDNVSMLKIAKKASSIRSVMKKLGALKLHYVGWNNRYDKVVPLASSRIEE